MCAAFLRASCHTYQLVNQPCHERGCAEDLDLPVTLIIMPKPLYTMSICTIIGRGPQDIVSSRRVTGNIIIAREYGHRAETKGIDGRAWRRACGLI